MKSRSRDGSYGGVAEARRLHRIAHDECAECRHWGRMDDRGGAVSTSDDVPTGTGGSIPPRLHQRRPSIVSGNVVSRDGIDA